MVVVRIVPTVAAFPVPLAPSVRMERQPHTRKVNVAIRMPAIAGPIADGISRSWRNRQPKGDRQTCSGNKHFDFWHFELQGLTLRAMNARIGTSCPCPYAHVSLIPVVRAKGGGFQRGRISPLTQSSILFAPCNSRIRSDGLPQEARKSKFNRLCRSIPFPQL
jgi:hypothetical protein